MRIDRAPGLRREELEVGGALALRDGELDDRRDTDHVMDGNERCRDVESASA